MSTTLVACPFCRELYERGEAEMCPVCGVVLRPLHDLPPSFEAREQQAALWEQTAPDDRPLPLHHFGRGRALVLGCSLLGLGLFFAPWIVLTKPELITLSGFDLAGARGFWFAGGAVGWFIMLPLVITRRTINQMRGARLVITLFSSLTAFQALLLWALSPTDALVPLSYSWGWGFQASTVVSVVATALAMRFGGPSTPPLPSPSIASVVPPAEKPAEVAADNEADNETDNERRPTIH